MRLLLTTLLLLLACGATGAAAIASAAPPADAGERSVQRQATDLLNRASQQVQRERRACAPPELADGREAWLTDAEPSAAVRSVLAPFRRAPTLAELAAGEERRSAIFLPGTVERSRRGTRILHAADGHEVRLTAIPKVVRPGVDPAVRRACLARTRKRAARLARSAPPAVRREVRRMLDVQRAAIHAVPASEGEALSLYVPVGDGTGGGTGALFDAEQFSEHGLFLSSGGAGRPGASSQLTGVVPDGVATVELEYPRSASRGPSRPAVDYGSEARLTVAVTENAVSVSVPRGAEDAFPPRMTWRGADGAVIRVVTPPGR